MNSEEFKMVPGARLSTATTRVSDSVGFAKALHAQSKPPAYLVGEVEVNDPESMKPYLTGVIDLVAKYGGKYIVRGGHSETLEGSAPTGRFAIVQFNSSEELKRFWESAEYQEIAKVRQAASTSRFFVIEGYLP